ncbi:MAG: SURF1 family protein [Alphaproteobacteria bacterium]|nr:SURF1 family protein [Alphaproteobacteria bacterium]
MTFTFKNFIAALLLLSGAVILCTLGYWQVQRLEWKSDVIEALEREYNKSTEERQSTLTELRNADKGISYITLKGTLLFDKEIKYGPKSHDGEIGYHIITPLKTKAGTVLVSRGWVDDTYTAPSKTKYTLVTGIIRAPDWNRFTPNNNPSTDVWTKLDISQIAQVKNIDNVFPKILYATESAYKNDPVITIHSNWYPRNKHKQYAIFWFSIAFIFLGFFGFYISRSRRSLS